MSTFWIAALAALVYLYLRRRRHQAEEPPARTGPSRAEAGEQAEREHEEEPKRLVDSFPAYAEKHIEAIERNFEVRLSYDEASFARLDEIIEEGWGGGTPALPDTTVLSFGSFVGECIRRLLGGQWEYDEEMGYCLAGIGGTSAKVFPFGKVRKRFANGEEDSLAFYYAALKHIVEQERGEARAE